MPSYAIKSSRVIAKNLFEYDVILKADDGYWEEQKYVGDSTQQVLVDAAKHMSPEWMLKKSFDRSLAVDSLNWIENAQSGVDKNYVLASSYTYVTV